jgi:periplasmic protein TonB
MKLIRKLLFIFCCIHSLNTKGQCDSLWYPYNDRVDSKEIGLLFFEFEEMPEYPGGEAARLIFMKENIKFPPNWPSDSIKGKVFTTFIIDENGNIKCPRILRGINSTLDSIAIAVIKKMPRWSPAKAGGVSVSSTYNLPVIFGTYSKTKK